MVYLLKENYCALLVSRLVMQHNSSEIANGSLDMYISLLAN